MMHLVLVFLIIAIGAFLQSAIGFGFGVFCMAFLPYLFPYGTAVAFSLLMSMCNSTVLTIRYHRCIDWKVVLPFAIANVLVGTTITALSASIDNRAMMLALGCMLIALAAYFFLVGNIAIHPTPAKGVALGAVTGVTNGFFGIGGPTTAMYLLPSLGDKVSYQASTQFSFVVTAFAAAMMRIVKGMMPSDVVPSLGIGLVGVAVGTFLGIRIFSRLHLESFKRLVYLLIAINGVVILGTNW